MKRKLIVANTVLLALCVGISCSTKDQVLPTSLQITLLDQLGAPVSGVTVTLYTSHVDMESDTNRVGAPQKSDFNGQVTFANLAPLKYYWFAESGCNNNIHDLITTKSSLGVGINNTVNSILTPTGTLKFSNNSTDSYSVYINALPVFVAAGGHTYSISYSSIGVYIIRVVQLSGFVSGPTDQTYNGTLTCGGTFTTIFPN